MTFESPSIAVECLTKRGVLEDITIQRLYSYVGIGRKRVFAMFSDVRHDDMDSSPYVSKPVLLMDVGGAITPAGQQFLEENGS